MKLSPDETIYWQYGSIVINATLVWTWVVMAVIIIVVRTITRRLSKRKHISRGQTALEIIVKTISGQLKETGLKTPEIYIAFLGTLFLFVAISNFFTIVPFYEPPTSSLSTTTALALSVFLAVPFYGIKEGGLVNYLKTFIEPTFVMLPFNIIGELSRTLALAIRLFGNMMSGTVIIGILLSVMPLFFPIIMNALGLLTGMVQAYILTILATVYIAAATEESKTSKLKTKK